MQNRQNVDKVILMTHHENYMINLRTLLPLCAALLVSASMAGCGGGGSNASRTDDKGSPGTSTAAVTTLVGIAGRSGFADGAGVNASLHSPEGIALDAAGNLYVADSGNAAIRKVTPEGIVSTLAGGHVGWTDGLGSAASFWGPSGIAVDSAGNTFVAESGSYTIRKITPAGLVTTYAGKANQYGSQDGPALSARFLNPRGLTVAPDGTLYVADEGNNVVRKISPTGTVSTIPGTSFDGPVAVGLDAAGVLYVADSSRVWKVTPDGAATRWAGGTSVQDVDGPVASAQFANPLLSMVVDRTGTVFVTELCNTVRKITPAGMVTTLAGKAGVVGGTDGIGPAASFNWPSGIAASTTGTVYVSEEHNHTIRKITQ